MDEPFIPPPEEGEIVIKGTYTTKSGQEVPVEIHTGERGLIYQRWREELARRGQGGVRELKEGEIIDPISKESPYARYATPEQLQKQVEALDIEAFEREAPLFPQFKYNTRTLIERFAEEKALDLARIQLRLEELRAQLKHAPNADPIRAEILDLEKKLLGDP